MLVSEGFRTLPFAKNRCCRNVVVWKVLSGPPVCTLCAYTPAAIKAALLIRSAQAKTDCVLEPVETQSRLQQMTPESGNAVGAAIKQLAHFVCWHKCAHSRLAPVARRSGRHILQRGLPILYYLLIAAPHPLRVLLNFVGGCILAAARSLGVFANAIRAARTSPR